jgi:hypothetical protein
MRTFLKSKKGIAALIATLVVAISAVGAYAYWTSTGTGQGTATAGTSANNLYVRGTSATTLTPGGPTSTVSFTAKNFANFAQSISNIHLASVKACDVAWTFGSEATYPVPAATCGGTELTSAQCGTIADGSGANTPLTADFYLADVAVDPDDVADGNLAANADRALTSTGTLVMNDTSDNQNPCKSQNLLLTFTTA